ncbi:MAG: GNAT family N-acetyltransferase [Gammaproteobacteria bacterium]|nr:GNAT family N-acetyltransferase [Gammaproteobacteria bacterium]
MPTPRTSQHLGMAAFSPAAWDSLDPSGNPFVSHAFLAAMESSGSVTTETGWEPCHIGVNGGDSLLAAMPLYRKHHSFGEFVFDWGWADACQRAGIAYYPKLLTAAPYSPVTGPRLIGSEPGKLIEQAKAVAEEGNHVSWHVLFPNDQDRQHLQEAGLLIRKDSQFQWFNRDYNDFDGFLAALKSKRRKEIRRERRQVADAGIRFRRVTGHELDEPTLARIYDCYASTYQLRGQMPYLTPDFFRQYAAAAPDSLVCFVASREDDEIAVAICLRDAEALYGRYWGSLVEVPGLHFEACYYQGIEYCLEHGLGRFEPGTQGEHKISRGFEPVPVWSAHWIRHPGLRTAIAEFLDRETPMVDRYISDAATLLPFRSEA